ARDVTISDVSDDRRQYLDKKFGVTVTGDNLRATGGVDVVILAIKPQNLIPVMAEIKGQLQSTQLVLSIIAGVTIKTLSEVLDHKCIVRVMPNTPAQVMAGMSVWTATAGVTEQQKELTGSILRAIGEEIYVDDEKYLDMATAVSGSGPAYYFLFVEALVEAAVDIGLSQDMAQELVLQTMLGSGNLIRESGRPPAELRRMVTSQGGTTAEALKEFDNGEFKKLVGKAVTAAYNKARILGGEQK
ncbi:pyrroline-5-carboxylate reductase, partial [Chloroflexota bacterium]